MKAKNVKAVVIVLAFAVVCAAIGYHFSYPIALNRAALPGHIQDYYNRGRSVNTDPAVVLYDSIGIGKQEYILVEIGEELGSVTLEKGLTGRYRFTNLSYGGGSFLDGIVESGGRKYFLLGGRDFSAQISKVAVLIDGQTYEMDTGHAKDHFLLCTEIDHRVEDKHVSRDHIRLYDEAGEDITELYNLSGGGI